jgi:hypothetical protein
MFFAAGCAGNRSGGQVAAGDVVSTTIITTTETTGQPGTTTQTTKKATSRTTEIGSASTSPSIGGTTPTTRRRPTTSTRPGSGTTASRPTTKPTSPTKPAVSKVKLTLTIENTGNVEGAVAVSPGGTCRSTCTFTFTKGASVELEATAETIEAHERWTSEGRTICGQGRCFLEAVNVDTAMQAIFGSKTEGDG